MDREELLDFLDNLDNIENEDERYSTLFRVVGEIYDAEMSMRNNDDYEVDPEGMRHFTEFASFMARVAKESDGRVELDLHEPKENIAGITTYMRVFWLVGDQLRDFCQLLVWASSFSFDALTDGTVCFSVRFVGVYRKRQGK